MKFWGFLLLTIFTSNVNKTSTTEELCVPMGSSVNELYLPKEETHNKNLFGAKTVNADAYKVDKYNYNTVYTPSKRAAESKVNAPFAGGSAAAESNTGPQQFVKNTAPTTGKQNNAQMAAWEDKNPHSDAPCPDCGTNCKSDHVFINGQWYCQHHGKHNGNYDTPCIHFNPNPGPPSSPIGNGTFVLLLLSLMYCLFRLVKGDAQEE